MFTLCLHQICRNMANFQFCVRKMRRDGLFSVYVRVTHNRTVAYVKTDRVVSAAGVDRNGCISDPFVLRYCNDLLGRYIDRINAYQGNFRNAAAIRRFLIAGDAGSRSFTDFASEFLDRLCDGGRLNTWKLYKAAVGSLVSFCGRGEVEFESLTYAVLSRWMDSLGHTRRAKSLYPVCIRTIFKEAYALRDDPEERLSLLPVNPWTKIVIPEREVSRKLAVPAEDCRVFFSWGGKGKRQWLGRDVAMMSICLAGINTVDLYNLRKSDYSSGILHYCRSKTHTRRDDGAYFEIRVPEVLKGVMERYFAGDKSEYLFAFAEWYADAKTFNAVVNKGIKLVCEECGLRGGISYYTFRHSWATIAQNEFGKSLDDIGFAMNHRGNKVTRGYVKIDFSAVWELNERVVDFVFFSDRRSKLYEMEREAPDGAAQDDFSVSPGVLIRGCAFFKGRCVASFEDIGCVGVEDVISRLVSELPGDIPASSMVQFKIVNLDNGRAASYERMKGRGF